MLNISTWASTIYAHPQNCPFPYRRFGPTSNTWLCGPTQALMPNGISISSDVFAGFIPYTYRQTHTVTHTLVLDRYRISLSIHSLHSRIDEYNTSVFTPWSIPIRLESPALVIMITSSQSDSKQPLYSRASSTHALPSQQQSGDAQHRSGHDSTPAACPTRHALQRSE